MIMKTNLKEWIKPIQDQLLQIIKKLPWGTLLIKVFDLMTSSKPPEPLIGLYEVLEYESTLELKNSSGSRATFSKRQKVRYLQDNIIAYQDQAWGDGQILLGYRCTPGVAVDRYPLGHKTMVLISLREMKSKNSIDEFHIVWGINNGFLQTEEQWETEISHPTRRVKINILFPKSRGPEKITVIESGQQRSSPLPNDSIRRLPDGHWLASWEIVAPRIHERYVLKWTW